MYTCGTLKPLRRPTTLVFCDKKQLMTMDRTAAGYEVAGSIPYFMDLAREPVLQLVRHPNNSTFKMWKDNKCGVPGIPEQSHATRNCACLESSLGNNVEAGYFFAICIPREFLLLPKSLVSNNCTWRWRKIFKGPTASYIGDRRIFQKIFTPLIII